MMMLLLTITLLACNQSVVEDPSPSDEPGIIGYVMDKEGGRILVVNPEAQDFSATGGISEYYDAIWFANAPEDIEVGEKVKVWYDNVLDSYPAQSEAIHVEIIPGQKPNGANLSETDALYQALTSQLMNIDSPIVVKNIRYDDDNDIWEIELKDTWGEEIYNIQVDDK